MSSHFVSAHFGAAHYESSHYGRGAVIPPTEPEVIHPMGSDPRTRALRARILREDEEILAIVVAFMEIKD
jgi:hypothetical protein